MSKAYIPKNTWVVCTMQQNPTPGKLIATKFPGERERFSVLFKGDKDLIFLTVGDRNTAEKFVCKKPMNLLLGIGGLVVGLILASNPIGWVVIGICAVVLVASVTIAIVTHDCSEPLKLGKWVDEKDTVYFDKQKAILETSLLTCDNGGVLKPIIDEATAISAAKAIAFENIKESVVTTAVAVVTGFFMGKGGGFFSALGGMFSKSGALLTLGGIATSYGLTTWQSNSMRGSEEYADNDLYQRMNKAEAKDWSNIETYGAATDALDSGAGISNRQTSIYQNTTVSNTTIRNNGVFVADGNGNITKPGTSIRTTTISANNQLPNSSIGISQTQTSQNQIYIRTTPNIAEISATNSTSVYGTQYNNSLRSNVSSGLKESFGGGKFGINGLLKGVGINMIIDIFRATSNWFLASQIKELNDAMNNEETDAKEKITVIAGND